MTPYPGISSDLRANLIRVQNDLDDLKIEKSKFNTSFINIEKDLIKDGYSVTASLHKLQTWELRDRNVAYLFSELEITF